MRNCKKVFNSEIFANMFSKKFNNQKVIILKSKN